MASLILNNGYYKWHIQNGTQEVSVENLIDGSLYESLYEQFTIGSVNSKQLDLSLWNVDFDPQEPIVLSVDAIDANDVATNYPKGKYFIDTIEKSPYSEYVKITAYDAMLKANVPFMVTGEWSAATHLAIVQSIADTMGVSVNDDTLAALDDGAEITEAPSIGNNGTTCRDMLSYIAILRSANWIINDNDELQLVYSQENANFVVQIDDDGNFVIANLFDLDSSDTIVCIDSSGTFVATTRSAIFGKKLLLYSNGRFKVGGLADIRDISVVEVGDEVREFDVSPIETVDRVMVWQSSSGNYRSPSDLTDEEFKAMTGKIISVNLPLMASQDVADDILGYTDGYEYVPYTASGAFIDPYVPLGTLLHIKNDYVYLTNRTIKIDVLSSCDLSADPTEQQKSLYPKVSQVERDLFNETEHNYQRITVAEGMISSEVSRATEAEGELSSRIEQTAEDIRLSFNQSLDEYEASVEKYIRFSSEGIELGESDSALKTIIDNEHVGFTGDDGNEAAWVSGNEFHGNDIIAENSYGLGTDTDPTDADNEINIWTTMLAANNAFTILYTGN